MSSPNPFLKLTMHETAIDPMAMILPANAYLIWVELHHPHVPKVADIVAVLRRMTPEERNAAAVRARTLAAYGKAFEEAIGTVAS